jgi:hypothetical protein
MAKKRKGAKIWDRKTVVCYKCGKQINIGSFSSHDCKVKIRKEKINNKKRSEVIKHLKNGELNKPYTKEDLKNDNLKTSRKYAGFVKK